MRALGVDLGSRRIGLAVSDSDGRVATPYEVLERSGDRERDHQAMAATAAELDAEVIVVGLPRSLDGTLGPAALAVLSEVAELAARCSVPVVTYDERLTTVSAERSLMNQNLSPAERRAVVDKVAASVILQAWLDAGCPLESTDG